MLASWTAHCPRVVRHSSRLISAHQNGSRVRQQSAPSTRPFCCDSTAGHIRHYCVASVAPVHTVIDTEQLRWQLHCAVCVERRPVVVAPLSPVELAYSRHLQKLEVGGSLLSDHEMRHKNDLQVAAEKRAALSDAAASSLSSHEPGALGDGDSLMTAADLDEQWANELATFTPAAITTEADESGDTRSVRRLLHRGLVLVVKQSMSGASPAWCLPQRPHAPGETLRQTAEATVSMVMGDAAHVTILGNAPFGVYRYKYPKSVRHETGFIGAKVFFYKAFRRCGQCMLSSQVVDFSWLSRCEMRQQLKPSYMNTVDRFLISDL